MERNAIAENIRRLREERHWTQEELAAASGVDVRTIQRAEAGKPLQLESLKALAAVFNTTIEGLSVSEEDLQRFMAEFRARFVLIEMRRLETGPDLAGIFGTDAYLLQRIGRLSDEQLDAVAEFEQELRDYGDIWNELEPMHKRDAERAFGNLIERLQSLDLSVSAGTRTVNLRAKDRDGAMRISTLYVAVVAGKTPLLYLTEEKGKRVSFA